jgi:HPr kinase/phosphorylase
MAPLTVGTFLERTRELLELEVLGSTDGFAREIPAPDASGPGLVLAGYVGRFVPQRIQVLGETEVSYLRSLPADERQDPRHLSATDPCLMVTKGLISRRDGRGRERRRTILRSKLKTQEFYNRIAPFLADAFAPSTSLHGSLADVYGVGLLFTGASGIGKSECVLDLVERGHRLVADDLVITRRKGADVLIGTGHPLQRHYMEIRGVGLIDVRSIFGVRSVRQQKRVEVVVVLQEWKEGMSVERPGLETDTTSILGVEIPRITVPLNPGKNIPVIAEVIAMNHLMRYSGQDPAQVFNDRLKGHLLEKADVQRYLLDDDE